MALFTPLRSPDMNTRTGLAPRTLPVHLMMFTLIIQQLTVGNVQALGANQITAFSPKPHG